MRKRTAVLGAAAIVALAGYVLVTRGVWNPMGAVAQAPGESGGRGAQTGAGRPAGVPVEVVTAARKQLPVRVDSLGTVTPMASVAIKTRIDSEIVGVHFSDGAMVKTGDPLFTLDSRSLEAQLAQAEGNTLKSAAQLEGAERDFRRFTELIGKGATTQVNVDNAKMAIDMLRGTVRADQATVDNLKVQLSYTKIRAPISGRMSAANVKVGNIARAADPTPLATINQVAPIYVSFTVPQRVLPDVRQALANESATIEALVPGEQKTANGQVSMIENAVDAATGMVIIRATMPNQDELLWPGTLVNTRLTLRIENVIVVPSVAVQASQQGNFVFVVKDGKAAVRPVKVARTLDLDSVIESGLEEGETVVTDGQLLLTNGASVATRERKAGS
jgi:RND family efflux transporter MFP subunit